MDEASRCDRLLLMRDGRLLADDTLRRRAAHAPAADDVESAFLTLVDRPHRPSDARRATVGRCPHEPPAHPRHRRPRAARSCGTTTARSRCCSSCPCVLIGLLAWIFDDTPVFDRIGAPLLGIFPFIVMFLVTSVATLRERQTGTLERLLTMPLGKGDLIGGYALAFGAARRRPGAGRLGVRALRAAASTSPGPAWLLVVVAVVDALLGTALGLFVSAFARTEFQAVQFMPAFVLPQFLLCGLLVPRDDAARRCSARSPTCCRCRTRSTR